MGVGMLELEVESKCSADKMWGGFLTSEQLFPKIFPDKYKSIAVVEGDGKGVGTVRLVNYVDGTPLVKFTKEKVEMYDEEKKKLAYSVVDGELLSMYKTFRVTLQVSPKGEGCVAKWSLEYDKAGAPEGAEDAVKAAAVETLTGLGDYLAKN